MRGEIMIKSDYKMAKEKVFALKKLSLRAQHLDLMAGGTIVLLNAQQANQNDIYTGYRIILRSGRRSITAMVDLTNDMVQPGAIGLFHEAWSELKPEKGGMIEVELTSRPESIEYIKNKLDGKELDPHQIQTIIGEVMQNRLSEGEMSA